MCVCVQFPQKSEEDTGSPGTGVIHRCESPYWVLEDKTPIARTAIVLNCQAISPALLRLSELEDCVLPTMIHMPLDKQIDFFGHCLP